MEGDQYDIIMCWHGEEVVNILKKEKSHSHRKSTVPSHLHIEMQVT